MRSPMHKWAIRVRVSVCAAAGAALGRPRLGQCVCHTCSRAEPAASVSSSANLTVFLPCRFSASCRQWYRSIFPSFYISFLYYYTGTVLWLCTLPAGIPSCFTDTTVSLRTRPALLIVMLFSHLHTKQLERVTKNCLNSTLTRNSGYIFPFAIMSQKLTGHYAGCERCSCVWLSRHNTVAVFYWLRFPLIAFQLPLKCSS